MDFQFTSEQTQLADALRRLIDKDHGFEARKHIVASSTGTSDALWDKFVELGLLALPMPEAHGGFGGKAVDLVLVMQELGRGLVASPYFATVFAAEFVKRAGGPQLRVLDEVAAGTMRLAAALAEASSRYDLSHVRATAIATESGFALTGEKTVVAYGAHADRLVVSAMLDRDTLGLFLVDARAERVVRHDQRTLDGQRVASVAFDRVEVPADALLAKGAAALALVDAVSDYGVTLLCAEAFGAMQALHAATVEYAKTRKQFGQPIGRFQVLQHRMVDMFMHLEQARSMVYLAAAKVDSPDADERARTVSAAKVRVGQAARFIGQQAVQIHGGMGVTDELPAAHLFKRLTMIEMMLGDTDHHLQRFIARSRHAAADAQPARTRGRKEQLQRVA